MEIFPWWNEEHKKFAVELTQFVDEVIPRDEEARWKGDFPWDVIESMAEKGFFGAPIPKEYGGLGLGQIGTCIFGEQMGRIPGIGRVASASLLGGLKQLELFGTEEQKKRFLPRIARGELGAIAITEPFAGTDTANTQTIARRAGDTYFISGKKRFIVAAGIAQRYMLYARTSDAPEDRRSHRHLTGFLVEKGMPGFSTEKINEIIGFDSDVQNGVINLDEVPVPVENRIGNEGDGWKVMMAGLNFERTTIAAIAVGWIGEMIRSAVPYVQRRVQFGRKTGDFENNQFKLADLFMKLKIARLGAQYTSYLIDLGHEPTMYSTAFKVFNVESAAECARDAIQLMGGDGVTKFYFPWIIHNVAKVEEIAGGTMEACRLIAHRFGLRELDEATRIPRRVIHKELGVPITTFEKPEKGSHINEEELLQALAEDYLVNPGLHMSYQDLRAIFDVKDEELEQTILSLEQKGLLNVYRTRKGIELVKATYEGLKKANPPEYYQWFPRWIDEKRRF